MFNICFTQITDKICKNHWHKLNFYNTVEEIFINLPLIDDKCLGDCNCVCTQYRCPGNELITDLTKSVQAILERERERETFSRIKEGSKKHTIHSETLCRVRKESIKKNIQARDKLNINWSLETWKGWGRGKMEGQQSEKEGIEGILKIEEIKVDDTG